MKTTEAIHSRVVHGTEPRKIKETGVNGIFNLVTLVAILSICRYLIEDYKDYGLIMKIPLRELSLHDSFFFILDFSILFVCSLVCFGVEKSRLRKIEDNSKAKTPKQENFFIYTFLFFAVFTLMNILIGFITFYYIHHVYIAGWSVIVSIVGSVKVLSFYLVSSEIQTNTHQIDHFLYFLVAPTLCYQLSYPMNDTRSYKRIAVRGIQLVVGLFLFVFVMDQYSISSIYRAMENKDYLVKIENIINVAISTAFLFLIFFHLVFVCALDVIAEATLFRDREFYQAWWNSRTVGEFWSLWNIPVHNYFKRHLYIPLVMQGTNKQIARAYCFFVSAILHELVLSLATKKICGWVFLGMIFQVPNIYVSELVFKYFPTLSNYFFWCSFCVIGQPTIVLLYYRSKYLRE